MSLKLVTTSHARSLTKITHGKKGVPEMEIYVTPERMEEYQALPCPGKHEIMRHNRQVFLTLISGQPAEQREHDGFVLLLIGECSACGSSVAYPPSLEARMRLEETHDQTHERHTEGDAL